ncbi:MAG: aldo/keto reductase [Pseudoclavibacter sp.]
MSSAPSAANLVLGTNVFGWTSSPEESHRILNRFAELGGRHIDTADSYSEWAAGNDGGISERIIGEWLAGRDRSKFSIGTKVGQFSKRRGLHPDNIRAALAESLERLGVDHVDVYYAHADDDSVPLADLAKTFSDLVAEGLIRSIGVSNFSAARLREWSRIADERGLVKPTVLQPLYNAVQREGYEAELAAAVSELGLDVLPYAGLARGFLVGKYTGEEDLKGSARAGQVKAFLTEENLALLSKLQEIAAETDATTAAAALAWLYARPGIAGVIASVSSADQLDALLGFDRDAVIDQISQLQ